MTNKEKVLNYIKEQKSKGLVHVDFYFTDKIKGAKEDSVYDELWRMITAPDLPDEEVLGKYSPW